MNFIKNWLIKRALKKANNKSEMEKIADDVLKDAMKELQQTGRTADKILQAKLIRQESQHTLNKIREIDEEFDDDSEDEEPQSIEDTLTSALLTKLLGGNVAPQQQQQKGEPVSFDDDGNPVFAATSQPQSAAKNSSVASAISKLSEEDINSLKKKFL